MTVRLVRATAPFEVQGLQTISTPGLEIDRRISDLQSKLQNLHYSRFRMVSSYQDVVPLMKKRVMQLDQGQSLAVRPLYIRSDRIGLWLRWVDRNGEQLLDTRMHFEPDESIVSGFDVDGGEAGTVLAVNVSPAASGN